MHPRVGLHQVAFLDESTPAFLDHCRRIGVQHTTLVTASLMRAGALDEAQQALAGGAPHVEAVNHQFAVYPDLDNDRGQATEKLLQAIDIAAALGASSVYLQTGGRGYLTWEQAAERFTALIAPCTAAAAAQGVRVLVENASSFNADIHIAHTLADTITLAELAGIGLCIEWHACWMEAGLKGLLQQAIPMTGLMQVSDYVLGDRTAPCRAVPGDGVIPLDRILGDVLQAGYEGVFDIELVGPRIAAEGARAATQRAAQRVSEPEPMAYGDGPSDEELRNAWHRFCDQLRSAGDDVFKDANPGSPLLRADAFRFLTQNLGQAFDLALESKDPAFPQLHPFCTPTRKLGGDVADFTYRQAWIDGDHAYRISGNRGTARWLNVTVQGPRPDRIPGTDWPSLHEPFGDIPETNIFGHQITTEADGSFELYVGGEIRAENWLPTTPGSRKLFIREAFDAWFETPTTLSIERIGMDGPRPIPTPERIIEAMGWAGDFITGAMRDWPEHSWKYSNGVCDPAFKNQFPPERTADTDDDVKRGRLAAHMIWELRPDEALIVEMENHDGFWIFGMGNVFAASMDFLYRPVSYTPARTKVDSDGVVRLVIAHDDPGVHNWLDTQGFSNGNLTYRNLMSQNLARFRNRLVKRSELLDALPPGTAMVSEGERVKQMLDRYHSIKLRYGI